MNKRRTGKHYEEIAGAYLKKQGYKILQYNFHCRYAEIDIIALDGNVLVFCEIKYRSRMDMCQTLESVDLRKQQRISLAALFYMRRFPNMDLPCRFDVIGISGNNISLIKNAFEFKGV